MLLEMSTLLKCKYISDLRRVSYILTISNLIKFPSILRYMFRALYRIISGLNTDWTLHWELLFKFLGVLKPFMTQKIGIPALMQASLHNQAVGTDKVQWRLCTHTKIVLMLWEGLINVNSFTYILYCKIVLFIFFLNPKRPEGFF